MYATQIGGKYHQDDDSVFRLKERLARIGVSVSHPIADKIMSSTNELGFAFDTTRQSFEDVERHYYRSIATSDFHTVCNQFGAQLGYTGASASLEMAFAMCHKRPIVLLHPARLTPGVDPCVRFFLQARLDRVSICNLFSISDEAALSLLSSIGAVDYTVSAGEQHMIEMQVTALLNSLQAETADVST